MTLIKTSFLTAIATIIKVIVAFIINKFLSFYVGPSGLAIVGQMQDFVTLITTLANGGTGQGLVKYTSEYKTIDQKKKIFSTSVLISLVCSFFMMLLLILFNDSFSVLVLKSHDYANVFTVFGVTLFLFGINVVLLSILNGQKEIKKFVLVNIANSIFSLIITSVLVVNYNLIGALYSLVVNQSLVFFVTLFFVINTKWFKFSYFFNGVDKNSFKKLIKFSLMTLVSALMVPFSLLVIRNYIGSNLSWDSAGYWQGIWYISSVYLMIITSSLSIYYLPKLSELTDKNELIKEIISGYKIIMPIVCILAISIFLFREQIILIAFSDKFMPMKDLFAWQLIGDVIKMASWLLSYLLIAKAMTKYFIATEIIFSLTFMSFSILFIDLFGLVGITYAFTLNYIIYFITVFVIVKKELK